MRGFRKREEFDKDKWLQECVFMHTSTVHYRRFLNGHAKVNQRNKNKYSLNCNLDKSKKVSLNLPVINEACETADCYFEGEELLKYLKLQVKIEETSEYKCPGCKLTRRVDAILYDVGLQFFIESFRRKTANLRHQFQYFQINEETNNDEEWQEETAPPISLAFNRLKKLVDDKREREDVLQCEQSLPALCKVEDSLNRLWMQQKVEIIQPGMKIMVSRGKGSINDGIETLIIGRESYPWEEEEQNILKQPQPKKEAQSTKLSQSNDRQQQQHYLKKKIGIFLQVKMEKDGRPTIIPRESQIFYSEEQRSVIIVTTIPWNSKPIFTVYKGQIASIVNDTICLVQLPITTQREISQFGAAIHDNFIYFAGGLEKIGSNYCAGSSLCRLNLKSKKLQIEELMDLKRPRICCRLFAIRNEIYILGGLDLRGKSIHKRLEAVQSFQRIALPPREILESMHPKQFKQRCHHEQFNHEAMHGYNTIMLPFLKQQQNNAYGRDIVLIIRHNEPKAGSKQPRYMKSCYVYDIDQERKRERGEDPFGGQQSANQTDQDSKSTNAEKGAVEPSELKLIKLKKRNLTKTTRQQRQKAPQSEQLIDRLKRKKKHEKDTSRIPLKNHSVDFYLDSYSINQLIIRCKTYQASVLKFEVKPFEVERKEQTEKSEHSRSDRSAEPPPRRLIGLKVKMIEQQLQLHN